MTEQERPRTEAEPTTWMGRSLLRADRRAFTDAVLRSFVLAIEEAARTEGRQQAVRDTERKVKWLIGDPPEWLRTILIEVAAMNTSGKGEMGAIDPRGSLGGFKIREGGLAGLNASESPPHRHVWNDDGVCVCGVGIGSEWIAEQGLVGDASESGQPSVALDPISGLPEHVVGPIAGEIAGLHDPQRCDRIVNNGMGEPTECGRSLPCGLHDPQEPERG